ncbi:MAG: hypothetical protein WAV95_15965 [Azonexus sp.]
MPRATIIEDRLRELLTAIDLHTDCMTNQIDRAALDPYVDLAFVALSELWEAEPEPITFFPSVSQPSERTATP